MKANYKMHIYYTTGANKGNIKEIRYYNELETMIEDYNSLFEYKLYSLNPLCYMYSENGYKRICFNADFTINYLW